MKYLIYIFSKIGIFQKKYTIMRLLWYVMVCAKKKRTQNCHKVVLNIQAHQS